jgi:hypothetical protein
MVGSTQPEQLPPPLFETHFPVVLLQVDVPVQPLHAAPITPHWLVVSLAIGTQVLFAQQPLQPEQPLVPGIIIVEQPTQAPNVPEESQVRVPP